MSVTHTKVSAVSDGADTSLVRPSDWNATHTIDWAEAADISPVANAAAEGVGTEVPRSDHAHQDSAAGRVYAYTMFR